MKFLTALVLTVSCSQLKSQDTLWLYNGNRLSGAIKTVTEEFVRLKTYEGTKRIPVDSIASIRFESGYLLNRKNDEDIAFAQQYYDSLNSPEFVLDSGLYLRGADDALHHYKNYRKGQYLTGTITANLGPVIGLLPVLGFTSAKQNLRKLGVPDFGLFVNKSYKLGYIKTSTSMRRKGIWKSYGIGTLTHVISWGITTLALQLNRLKNK
jgi:hypothetical protein